MSGLFDYLRKTETERLAMFIIDTCRPSPTLRKVCREILEEELEEEPSIGDLDWEANRNYMRDAI